MRGGWKLESYQLNSAAYLTYLIQIDLILQPSNRYGWTFNVTRTQLSGFLHHRTRITHSKKKYKEDIFKYQPIF